MNLSHQQIEILKLFYDHKKISQTDLTNYGIDHKSSCFQSMQHQRLLTVADPVPGYHSAVGSCNIYTAYRITSNGEAAYEQYLQTLEEQQRQERQTIANEQSAIETRKANDIAKEANEIAQKANQKSNWALFAAIVIPILCAILQIVFG